MRLSSSLLLAASLLFAACSSEPTDGSAEAGVVDTHSDDDHGHDDEHAGHDHDDDGGTHAEGNVDDAIDDTKEKIEDTTEKINDAVDQVKDAVDGDTAMAMIAKAMEGVDTTSSNWKTKLPKPPVATFSGDKTYYWVMDTSHGEVKIKLMPDVAPMHVTSTIYLTQLGFYDDLTFHRVIPGFMAQGGCPLGKGNGNPGYQYSGETRSDVKHDRPGLLSMANTGRPSSDGSQFFLTFVPTPHLNGKHTIFGEVVGGMETLQAMEKDGTSPSGRTKKPILLNKSTIVVE